MLDRTAALKSKGGDVGTCGRSFIDDAQRAKEAAANVSGRAFRSCTSRVVERAAPWLRTSRPYKQEEPSWEAQTRSSRQLRRSDDKRSYKGSSGTAVQEEGGRKTTQQQPALVIYWPGGVDRA